MKVKSIFLMTAAIILLLNVFSVMNVRAYAETSDVPSYTVPDRKYDKYLFVGDSRFVGMEMFCKDDNTEYFAKVSQGHKWFRNNYDYITAYRGYNIVINLGVNDLYNINKYVDTYNSLPEDFVSGNNIIFLSVNPCQGKHSYLNEDIQKFNASLKDGLTIDCEFIDTYSYLEYADFATTDGLHYDKDTYRSIYDAVINGF